MKNRYSKGAHVSEARFREVIRFFAADLPVLTAAELSGLKLPNSAPHLLPHEGAIGRVGPSRDETPQPETSRWMRATLEPAESGVKEGVDQEARPIGALLQRRCPLFSDHWKNAAPSI